LVQLAIDVYSDCEGNSTITLGRTRQLIDNLVDMKGGNCQQYSTDAYEKFLLYIRSTPTISIEVNVPDISLDSDTDQALGTGAAGDVYVYYTEDAHLISTQAVHSFFAKKHRFIFWPLEMFQAQLQRVFMGSDLWSTLRGCEFCQYLKEKGVTADTYWFAEVLQKAYTTSMFKMKQMGTLHAVPFARNKPKTGVPRNKQTKVKLPPEAYAIKKRVPKDMVTQLKRKSVKEPDERVVTESMGIAQAQSRSSKSSKSCKGNTPSPLSGKYKSDELSPEPEPEPEPAPEPELSPGSTWGFKKLFTPKKSPPPANISAIDKEIAALEALSKSTVSGSGAVTAAAVASSGVTGNVNLHGGSSSPVPMSSQNSPGRRFLQMLTPSLPGKIAILPKLFSKDDSGGKRKKIKENPDRPRPHTINILGPIEKNDVAKSPTSPKYRKHSSDLEGDFSPSSSPKSIGSEGSMPPSSPSQKSPSQKIKLEKLNLPELSSPA
jgi:hypothetical protein